MGYYIVTIVSATGNRDTYGVNATGPGAARNAVAMQLLTDRPTWRAVSAVLAYML